MEKTNQIEKKWISTFEGTNIDKILSSILEIRNSGSINMLPHLFGMINNNTNPLVRNEIIKLISEIRSPEAVSIIANELDKNEFGDYLKSVIAACWQSGLNFSKYMNVFVRIFVQSDYYSALEAFTVIEESLANASSAEINNCSHLLKESECIVSDEKFPLYRELLKVVESY